MRAAATVLLGAVLALALGACGRADERAGRTDATTLTVYASLPLQGPGGREAEATANGARLALSEAGGKAGAFVVKLAVLDAAIPSARRWDPEQTAENARRVARDRTAIAYLGDGPSGATAISLPLLNSAGVPQVSPTSTYTGLTRRPAGPGEPERFFPSGRRSFARPVPADDVQARALVAAFEERGCRRLHLLDDRGLAGRGLAAVVARLAQDAGIAVVGRDAHRPGEDPVAEARGVAGGEADCVLVAAEPADWAPDLFDALHADDPSLELFGSDGLASNAFAATLDPGTQARTHLTAPVGIREPSAAVRDFARRYRRAFGLEARSGALYGHEAMRIVLAAIAEAGPQGNDRSAVMRALFTLGERRSPVGTYRIAPTGDTTSTRYSRLDVAEGRLTRPRTADYPPG